MTLYLLDSGFLYALIDEKDVHHKLVSDSRLLVNGHILFPAPAITEVAYFVKRNLGIQMLAEVIESLSTRTDFSFELLTHLDYTRTAEILRKYNDANVDFVDACIVAMAERLNFTKILTIDRRHFSIFRPEHCEPFEILP